MEKRRMKDCSDRDQTDIWHIHALSSRGKKLCERREYLERPEMIET